MAELSTAGDWIGDVVKLITSIANRPTSSHSTPPSRPPAPAMPAAGYAVVAQEVKNLAGQTAKATDEISSHIFNMQRATGESVGAIKAIGQTIGRISEITTSISSTVEEQGAATKNIAHGVQAAAGGSIDVAENNERVAHGARERKRRQARC